MKKIIRNKLFMATFFSDMLSNFGDSLYYLALMNYVLGLPDAKFGIALVTVSETLPMMSMLVIGLWADKIKNKVQTILGTQLLRTLLYVMVGLAMGFPPSLWVVIIAALANLLSDLSGQLESYLFIPIELRIVADEEREQSLAFKRAMSSSMRLVFQLSGAVLIGVMTYQNLAFFNAATFLTSAIVMLMIRPTLQCLFLEKPMTDIPAEQPEQAGNFFVTSWLSLKKAYQVAKGIPFFANSLLSIAFINAVGSSVDVLLMATLKEFRDFVLVSPAMTLAAFSVCYLIGQIIGSVLSTSSFQSVKLVTMTKLLALIQLPFFIGFFLHNSYLVFTLLLCSSLLTGMAGPKLSALMYREIPENQLATVGAGIDTLIMSGVVLMRLLLSGLVPFLSAQQLSFIFILLSLGLVGYTLKGR